MADVEAGRTAVPPAAVVPAQPATERTGPENDRITPVTIVVMIVSVALSCASVAVAIVHIIPGTALGWIGRVAGALVVVGLTLALSLLATPSDTDEVDDGEGAEPGVLTRIPRSIRDWWPWRLALAVALAWNAFLTYAWVHAVVSGNWPSEANDAALGAWAFWFAFAFLWAGKVPLKLGS